MVNKNWDEGALLWSNLSLYHDNVWTLRRQLLWERAASTSFRDCNWFHRRERAYGHPFKEIYLYRWGLLDQVASDSCNLLIFSKSSRVSWRPPKVFKKEDHLRMSMY